MSAKTMADVETARKTGTEIFGRMVRDGVDLGDECETEAAFEHAIEQYPLDGRLSGMVRATFLDCWEEESRNAMLREE